MWAVVLLSVLAGLIRSPSAASLIAVSTIVIVLIEKSGLWVAGSDTATLSASMVWWTIGETALFVLPAFAVGRLARYGFQRWRGSRKAPR